jgi:hypothetical protein
MIRHNPMSRHIAWDDPAPSDEAALLDEGFMRGPPPRQVPERVMLIACGALVADVQACIAAEGWWHVDIECLPARLHVHPERIAQALCVHARVATARGYGRIAALFGDCGSAGAIEALCRSEGIAMALLPHCGAMYDRRLASAGAGEVAAFYLTDFMLRHFEAMIWQPMRLDQNHELIEILFAPYERLVHLAQSEDPALDAAAVQVALRLNMPLEKRPAGPHRLTPVLQPLII